MEKRWLLFLLLTLVVLHVFSRFMRQEQQPGPGAEAQATRIAEITPEPTGGVFTPGEPERVPAEAEPQPQRAESAINVLEQELSAAEQIGVKTELFNVTFSTFGGKAISWQITDERFTRNSDVLSTTAIEIIPQAGSLAEGHEFPLEIGLNEYRGKDFSDFNRTLFDYEKTELPEGNTVLKFTSPEIEGIRLVKTFTFQPHNYLASCSIVVQNLSEARYRFNEDGTGLRLGWGAGINELEGEQRGRWSFTRALYLTEEGVRDTKPRTDRSEEYRGAVEWGGLENKFFLAVIIPLSEASVAARTGVKARNLTNEQKTEKSLKPPLTFEIFTDEFYLDPNTQKEFLYKIFVGPKEYDTLKTAGYRLPKVLFHTSWSWMRALCILLLKVLKIFYDLVHNYGLAIILLTLFIRVITHPLTHKGMKIQAKAMAEQQKLRPYIDEINKKYKGNAQMRNKEIMKLYKQHNVNPLGMMRGCFPLLLQMPIFFALYRLLMQSIELRGEAFLWIKDLSGPDALVKLDFTIPLLGPYINLLPLLMGLSQFLVSRFSTANIKDATQRQMMIFMPIFLTVILYNLPAGLVLYWLLSNIWQAGHQIIANKIIRKESEEAKHKAK